MVRHYIIESVKFWAKEYWEHRIKMCKALGMNTICLYVFWNFHNTFKPERQYINALLRYAAAGMSSFAPGRGGMSNLAVLPSSLVWQAAAPVVEWARAFGAIAPVWAIRLI